MRADAFGTACLSLDELIEALTDIRDRFPDMREQPCWIAHPPLLRPVTNVRVDGYWPPRVIVEVAR